MYAGSFRFCLRWLLLGVWLCAGLAAAAIDNPDAPDLVAAFQARLAPFEQRVSEAAGGDANAALAQQARFLDDELNAAYQGLLRRLDAEQRRRLVQSQRQWLLYRDAEFKLSARLWTRETSGSSANLGRGLYQAALVRQRIEQLLGMMRNVPSQ
jgi:uncharacterized protein YecT (DUF1311 family)